MLADKTSLHENYAPGKTFLAGEYLALNGGPAVILTTQPQFQLSIKESSRLELENIHPESPAGLLLNRTNVKGHFKFIDPFLGKGGLGASTAQFSLCYNFLYPGEKSITNLLSSYRQHAWLGTGPAPSGFDLLAQRFGKQISLVTPENVTSLAWPFSDLNFLLLRTGQKLATHTHLQNLKLEQTEDLKHSVAEVWSGLQKKHSGTFVGGLKLFRTALEEKSLVSDLSKQLVAQIETWPMVVFAKGCGALGADILFVLIQSSGLQKVSAKARELNLQILATAEDLYDDLNNNPLKDKDS